MVKVSQSKNRRSKRVPSVTNDEVSLNSDESPTTNDSNDADLENLDDPVNSNGSAVWRYATKVNAEKARCNICQTGK